MVATVCGADIMHVAPCATGDEANAPERAERVERVDRCDAAENGRGVSGAEGGHAAGDGGTELPKREVAALRALRALLGREEGALALPPRPTPIAGSMRLSSMAEPGRSGCGTASEVGARAEVTRPRR